MIDTQKSVGELVVEFPASTAVFEKFGIDYCCGGKKLLADACKNAGAPVDEVVNRINALLKTVDSVEANEWSTRKLDELTKYIVDKHHVFTREELERLRTLVTKVASRHGQNHPELATVAKLYQQMDADLFPHMMKEENILFPYIDAMQQAVDKGAPVPPPFFGTVKNPITMMLNEHEAVGDILREMRTVSNNYSLPADACMSYTLLYQGLEALERDLHEHIHIENNILFLRAAQMEEGAA